MTAPASETLTVLHARGRRLAKSIMVDGTVVPYDSAKTFDLLDHSAPDLDVLAETLTDLLARPDLAVVRAAIANPSRTWCVRRLVHRCPVTGDKPTLREQPRRWLALDLDGLPLPTGLARAIWLSAAPTAVAGYHPPSMTRAASWQPPQATRSSVKSSMRPTHAVNDNQIDRTRKVWQPRTGRDLTDEDARQIAENVTGFFSILAEWARAETPIPANDTGKPSISGDEEVRHDR